MQRKARWWVGAVLAALVPAAWAADGQLDPAFDGDGLNFIMWPGTVVQVEATSVAVLPDRSVVVAGWLDNGSNNRDFALRRFMADGTYDAWFGGSGAVVVPFDLEPGENDRELGVFPTAGGKLLVVGTAGLGAQPYQRPALLRLHADGTPDESFGPGGKRTITSHPFGAAGYFWFRAAAQDASGRILLAGLCSGCSDGGLSDVTVMRLDADGNLDTGFGNSGYARFGRRSDGDVAYQETALAVAADSVGRVVVAGSSELNGDPNEIVRPLVVRFTADGQLDAGFGGDGFDELQMLGSWEARAVAVDPVSNAAVVSLATTPAPSIAPAALLVRYLANGAMSASWGDDGFVNLSLEEGTRIDALAIRSDRRVVAAGLIDPNGSLQQDFFLARLLSSGERDNSFDGNGVKRVAFDVTVNSHDRAQAIALWKDQAIIAGTLFNFSDGISYGFGVLRLQSSYLFGDSFEVP
jgi:uncharacterized delta-60 repeat protein